MSVAALSKSSSVKCVQKLSKPRPLKLGSSGESENVPPLVSPVALTYANVDNINEDDVLRELESLHVSISNGNYEPATSAQVSRVCQLLKLRGAHMDAGGHHDQLDVYMVTLRSAARDDRLDVAARTRLLEVLELRGLKWRLTDDVAEFYKKLEPDSCTVTQVGGGGGQVVLPGPPLTLQQVQQQMQQVQQVPTNGHGHGPAMIIPQYIPFTQFPIPAGGHVQPNVLANVNVNVPLGQVQQQVQAAAAVQAVQAAAAAQAAAQAQAAQAAQAQAAQAAQVQAQAQAQAQAQVVQAAQAAAAAPFMPGEVLRSSGKFGKPAKVPGRNFLKDEVIIRNADSGKVMGIKGRRVHMIEELSDTVISFQRVSPGARDRLVQITGPTEESIHQAKQLIEETIRRNASPVREPSSLEEESSAGSSYEGGPRSPSVGASSPSAGALSPHEGPVLLGSEGPTVGSRYPPPLQHSLSTSDATVDRDYTYMVQGIKISAPKQQLALAAKAVLEQHFSAAALMLTEPNFIRVSQQGGGGQLPLVAGLATVGGPRGSGNYFHGSGKGKKGDGWSSSSSSDEDTYRRDTVITTLSGNADGGRQGGHPKSARNRNRSLVSSECAGDAEPKCEAEVEMAENKDENAVSNHGGRTAVLTRDQLLDLACSELTKKAPEDLDHLDPDFAVVIMRQDLAIFDVEAFRKWSPSGSGPSSGSSASGGHSAHHNQTRPSPPERSPPSSNDSEENTS
ncbi:hypothetical protein BIW11_10864 [Tropilaelaps mercedesae]|uniref:K Homology domain-containing protein n=1 Tax=Tropilaelaps mercedesae TaxID=418985 RepID=A0A1V9XE16_9ACAR|nr:hypothetical protein BIW11_10864 [Tropilaelaps mercedesae]